jgi:hypothetical protein
VAMIETFKLARVFPRMARFQTAVITIQLLRVSYYESVITSQLLRVSYYESVITSQLLRVSYYESVITSHCHDMSPVEKRTMRVEGSPGWADG